MTKGTKGAYLSPFSHYGESGDKLNWCGKSRASPLSNFGENEFLIQAGTPMEILDIKKDENGQLRVVMEVIL